MNRWIDEQMDRWIEGQMDRWIDCVKKQSDTDFDLSIRNL